MSTETPIACSLNPAELKQRLLEVSALGHDALRDVEVSPGQAVLRFAPSGETNDRLTAFVVAEARCCAFMNFDLRRDAEAIVLTAHAPAGAELVLDDLVAAFRGEVAA